ncbi:BamA/TamA family outer membrane protein [bacterium]|nr:BamA/TamA family outer membrane protein [bacterium]
MRRNLLVLLILLVCVAPGFAQDAAIQVSAIEIIGNQTTKEWVILRELQFDAEDRVTREELDRARLRLLSLGIFNNVRIDTDDEGVVTIQVSEQFRYIPVFDVSPVEGTINDALTKPGDAMKILVVTFGAADINHRGTSALAAATAQVGARTGFSLDYSSRWLSPSLPIVLRFGGRAVRVSNRHASVLGYELKSKSEVAYVEVATRRGAPSRIGLQFLYQGLHESDEYPAQGRDYSSLFINPFVALDRRNLEWYPTEGIYARTDIEYVLDSPDFVRSRGIAAAYVPFAKGGRGPSIAARLYGGISDSKTPAWAHYYFGFADEVRGYASEQAEAANFLSGEMELRFPITREITYDVPLVGRYGQDIPFWLGGALFVERAQLSLDGAREDLLGYGGAVHLRFPYVQVFEFSYAWNQNGEGQFIMATGVRF